MRRINTVCHAQIGMVTWLLALLAIELVLTHHAVWKVSHLSASLFCHVCGHPCIMGLCSRF